MSAIGKIGIPDRILLKPGKLDDEEWTVMQTPAQIGADIIGQHQSNLLRMTHRVALTHHERRDGKGYPNGLAGEAIPIEGRIAAISDVYDALLSVRPYKAVWPQEKAVELIVSQAGLAFDPQLLELFVGLLPEYARVRSPYSDTPAP